jgi:hypothetical protein
MTNQMGLKQIRDAVTALNSVPLAVEEPGGETFVGTVVTFDPIIETAVFEDAHGEIRVCMIQKIHYASPVADFCI